MKSATRAWHSFQSSDIRRSPGLITTRTIWTTQKAGCNRSIARLARSASCIPRGRTNTNCSLLSAIWFPKDNGFPCGRRQGNRHKNPSRNSGKRQHDPAKEHGDTHKGDKNFHPVNQLLLQRLLAEDSKHHRHEKRKERERRKMRYNHV